LQIIVVFLHHMRESAFLSRGTPIFRLPDGPMLELGDPQRWGVPVVLRGYLERTKEMSATPSATRHARHGHSISLVSDDVYAVMNEANTLGYIHKVGTVYVALHGDVLSHAVEVGQSLDWDQAVVMVRSSAR
jgi:hypothetical protein